MVPPDKFLISGEGGSASAHACVGDDSPSDARQMPASWQHRGSMLAACWHHTATMHAATMLQSDTIRNDCDTASDSLEAVNAGGDDSDAPQCCACCLM